MSITENQEKLEALADAYSILQLCCMCPSQETMQLFIENNLGAEARDIAGILKLNTNFQEYCTTVESDYISNKEEMLTQTRRDYTQLFAHPKEPLVNPYEALFLHQKENSDGIKPRLCISDAALSAESFYKRAGYVHEKGTGDNESADYMPIELEFVSRLLTDVSQSIDNGSQEESQRYLTLFNDFQQQHLSKWAQDFFTLVEKQAQSPWYKFVGAFGQQIVTLNTSSL